MSYGRDDQQGDDGEVGDEDDALVHDGEDGDYEDDDVVDRGFEVVEDDQTLQHCESCRSEYRFGHRSCNM